MTDMNSGGAKATKRASEKPVRDWRYYTAIWLRKLWTTCAVLLVSLAVSISVMRYSLPYMDSQKHYLESWLHSEFGTEVNIGYISAMWKGKGPAIVLKDVTIGDITDSPVALSVDETQIELDFWASVQQRQIQSQRFNLIGLSMEVDIPRIEGGTTEDFPILDALQTLFLEQLERFSVSDSEILVRNRVAEQRLQVQQLSWLNDEQRHQGVGQMRVAELARNSARFVLDLYGSRDSFQGVFFAEAEDLDLSPWIRQAIPGQYELQRSRGNFKLWAGLDNTKIIDVQAHLSESQFAWQSPGNGEIVRADLMKGDLFASPTANGWDLNLDDLTLIVNDKVFTSSWAGEVNVNRTATFSSLSELNLAPLLPLAGVLAGEQVNKTITDLNPQINIEKAQFFISESDLGAYLTFKDLSVAEHEKLPGINDFSGTISWLNQQGNVSLSSIHNYLSSEELLGFLLPYDELTFEAFFDVSDNRQTIYLPTIIFKNNELNFVQSLSYGLERGILSTQLQLEPTELESLKAYLPELIGPNTRAWLNRALKKGQVKDANVIWHGKVEDFPFNDEQGIFQAGATVENLELKYESSWPLLENANVHILFENDGIFISGEYGEISDIALSNATAVIPKLGDDAYIEIDAMGVGTGDLITSMFQESNLSDSVGKALEYVDIEGILTADINLHVPLTGRDIVATAQVNLADNNLYIPTLDLSLLSLNGVLNVKNEMLTAQGITAQLLEQQIELGLNADQSDEGYEANIQFAGNWNLDQLINAYHDNLSQYIQGSTDWAGELSLLFPSQGYSYSLQLNSQLLGVDSLLPSPAAKTAEQKLPIFLDSEGDQQASTVRILLGRDIKFNGILPHDTVQFSRAHMSVGGDNYVGMGLGFSLSADLKEFDYGYWQQFIGNLIDGLPESGNPIIGAPQRVFIETENMDILGQRFNNVEVLAKNRDTLWELQVDADQTRAEAILHKDWLQKGIEIDADFIKLGTSDDTQLAKETNFNRREFPPLSLKCEQCSYDIYDIGKVKLDMSRSSTGMRIDSLSVAMRDGNIHATGDWYIGDDIDSTRLKGKFNSDDFGSFLKPFKFDSGIRDSDADMDFDLSWQGAPYGFTRKSLGGDIDWRLGDGYLTEISDKGARLLSLLSLESLLRKLTLDFRDVFAKGFFYDDMTGTFQISDGIVNTQDTFIDGAAAGVSLRGTTDLVNDELNYVVNVNPKLTSNLPVLLAWMVNPATAVAAFAFDEVFTSAKVVSGIQYSLTGSLKEPQITLLEQTNKVVELPAKTTPDGPTEPKPAEPHNPYLDIEIPNENSDETESKKESET